MQCPGGRKMDGPLICGHGVWNSATCTSVLADKGARCIAALPMDSRRGPWCAQGLAHGEVCHHATCAEGYTLEGKFRCDDGLLLGAVCAPNRCVEPPAGSGLDVEATLTHIKTLNITYNNTST